MRSNFSCGNRIKPHACAMIRVLTHHNGVIHNNSKCNQQRKKRNHIDCDTRHIHQCYRCTKSRRDARSNPQRGAHIQKQKEQRHHQNKACQCIAVQHVKAARDVVRTRTDKLHLGAFRQSFAKFINRLLHGFLNFYGVALGGAINPNRNGGIRTDKIRLFTINTFHPYPCNVTDAQF